MWRLASSSHLYSLIFAKGLASVYESILFRTKLANRLKLFELVKYTKLMQNNENVSLAKVKHLLDFRYIEDCFVDVLPSNLILLYCSRKRNMVVLNKSGDLIRSKALQNDCYYDVQVNATNIVAYNRADRIVDVYNFNLELVHSIKLERGYFQILKLNNYEIALSNSACGYAFIITCYNCMTVESKKNEIYINTDQFEGLMSINADLFWFKLIDLNDRFIFVTGLFLRCTRHELPYNIFLLNRYDDNNLFWDSNSVSEISLIYNNQFVCEPHDEFFEIYDIHSPLKRESTDSLYKIIRIHSTSSNKHIYLKEFDFSNFRLKFDVY